MSNQSIKELPQGYEWQIVNYYTPTGVKRLQGLKFKDFDEAIAHDSMDGFQLFQLFRQGRSIMAFCKIGIKKK